MTPVTLHLCWVHTSRSIKHVLQEFKWFLTLGGVNLCIAWGGRLAVDPPRKKVLEIGIELKCIFIAQLFKASSKKN